VQGINKRLNKAKAIGEGGRRKPRPLDVKGLYMKKVKLNVTEFKCKKCGHLVWINNKVKEEIKNECTGEYFSKEFGLCRWCFINKREKGTPLTN
jgi:hypothetical protein